MARSYGRSRELYERAQKTLAGGVSSEFRKYSTPHPLFYAHAQGSRICDVDENEYLDFTLSQGPLILGHNHPEVVAAVEEASHDGQLFAGQHLRELELAEYIQRLVPCADLLRFGLSGSEAVHIALRTARAVTKRSRFIRFEGQYHGWFDNVSYGVNGNPSGPREQPSPVPWTAGLPPGSVDEFVLLPWNDLSLVESTLATRHHEISAVITEPIMCNNGCLEPAPGFLEGLRTLCDRYDVALIFDEVITGFRLNLGGAQQHYNVTPDIALFAKALANGYPISVIAGRHRWMEPIADGRVIHAGTLNSSVASIAAALSTLQVLERDTVHARLFALGERLITGLRLAAAEANQPLLVQGPGPMFHAGFTPLACVRDFRDTLSYDKARYAEFVAQMQERDIRLIGRGLWYISAAHTEEDIDSAIAAARAVLQQMRASA